MARVSVNRQSAAIRQGSDRTVVVGAEQLHPVDFEALDDRLGGMAKGIRFADRYGGKAWRDGAEKSVG